MRKIQAILWASLLLMVSGHLNASSITYNYSGIVVGTPTGIFAGQGDTVTGTFSFDRRLIDVEPLTGQDFYRTSGNVLNPTPEYFLNDPYLSSFTATMTIGSVTVTTAANDLASLDITDGARKYLEFRIQEDTVAPSSAEIIRTDFEFTASDDNCGICIFDGGSLDGTIDSAISILDNLELNTLFAHGNWNIINLSEGVLTDSVVFDWTSINPIPIPAAVWLFGTALIGLVGFSKRRKRHA